jgi:hypothetical protein
MSPKIRLTSAVLVLVALSCGSLGALPLGPRGVLPESGKGVLVAVVEWFVSLLLPEPYPRETPKPAQIKSGQAADPNGGPG